MVTFLPRVVFLWSQHSFTHPHVYGTGLDDFIALASSDLPSRRQGAVRQDTGKSFGGYSNLHGEILTIPVTKVNKKLGMAIDGGANTKQQAVTIRQITVS